MRILAAPDAPDDPSTPLPPPRIPLAEPQRERALLLLGCRSNGNELRTAKRDELIALVGGYPSPRVAARWKAWLKNRWPTWIAERARDEPPTEPPLPPRLIPMTGHLRDRAITLLRTPTLGDAERDELIALVGGYPPARIAARWRAWLEQRWPTWIARHREI